MAYVLSTKVKFSEVDKDGKVSFGKILDYFQDVTNLHSLHLGMGSEFQFKRKRVWILNAWQIKVNGDLFSEQQIDIETWAYSFKSFFAQRNFSIKDKYGKSVIDAESNWVMFDLETGKATRIEQEDIKGYDIEENNPFEYVKGRILKSENYRYIEEMDTRVVYHHIDMNNHMNNAWYVKISEDVIREYTKDKKIDFIRVEYRKAALSGDCIKIFLAIEEERYLVELRNEENEVYATVEFRIDGKINDKSIVSDE